MSAKLQIEVPIERIAEFCREWEIVEFSLFGSVLRPDFRPDSDVDVLVNFAPGAKPTLSDLMRMRTELAELFGRPVDLVDRTIVEKSPNYIRRRQILDSAEVLYGA